ncbi:MAG: hypothetical protein E6G74_06875 [Alphaproteobacteria bacterium]|nr:MAG: hypothetical protein E6G74_06875 [Alphaproteobacteria bacterium]
MKKLFLGSVALVALGLGMPAFAAERPLPAAPAYTPAPVAAYTNWSGCYVGASAGTMSGSSQHFDSAGTAITNSFDLSGFIGGGQLGCNWQFGAWVVGIEGDGSAVNKSGQGLELARPTWISETQERWFVTARGRLGLPATKRAKLAVVGPLVAASNTRWATAGRSRANFSTPTSALTRHSPARPSPPGRFRTRRTK